MKLKRLHKKNAHWWSGIGHRHDSSQSLYGYKDYFIKTNYHYKGWEVYKGEKRISPLTIHDMSFKEAKEWLKNHIEGENNESTNS